MDCACILKIADTVKVNQTVRDSIFILVQNIDFKLNVKRYKNYRKKAWKIADWVG